MKAWFKPQKQKIQEEVDRLSLDEEEKAKLAERLATNQRIDSMKFKSWAWEKNTSSIVITAFFILLVGGLVLRTQASEEDSDFMSRIFLWLVFFAPLLYIFLKKYILR